MLYVAEPIDNDGSPFSMVFKGLKRAMAAEYSRELSAKTAAGQRHLAQLGYRQGATAGYGLRRLLVGPDEEAKMVRADGDRKSLATDRSVLVPGGLQKRRHEKADMKSAWSVQQQRLWHVIPRVIPEGISRGGPFSPMDWGDGPSWWRWRDPVGKHHNPLISNVFVVE